MATHNTDDSGGADAARSGPGHGAPGMARQTDETPTGQRPRSRWGRVAFGRGKLPAMAVAVPAALVFAAITGAVAALAKWSAGPPLLAAGVFGLCSFPFWLLVFWVAVVDRPTLEGAVDRPEDSIEQWWYREAASGALTDVFALTGLGAAVLTFTKDWRIEASTVLWIVACCIPISFAIRYLLGRRRG